MFWKSKPPEKTRWWVVLRYPSESNLRYLDVVTRCDEWLCVTYLSEPLTDFDQLKAELVRWAELLGVKYKRCNDD